MDEKEALKIVLELAQENAIEEAEAQETDSLMESFNRQEEALKIVTVLIEGE